MTDKHVHYCEMMISIMSHEKNYCYMGAVKIERPITVWLYLTNVTVFCLYFLLIAYTNSYP